jgi:hypothetical protein
MAFRHTTTVGAGDSPSTHDFGGNFMENRKYTHTSYSPARVIGDAETVTGKNGKSYRVVPVELLGGRKSRAFCTAAPEVDTFVMVRVQHRENGVAYTVMTPSLDAVKFLVDAVTQWQYAVVQ